MLINEVIHIVGLSRKSIRYYESVGLINPSRNKNNDYRIYEESDIKKLKIIKFLRELDVPIKELIELDKNNISLDEVLDDRIKKIDYDIENYNKIKRLCIEIMNSNVSYNDINIDKYFRDINILNKEGFTMRDVSVNNKKKVIGAIISSGLFLLMFLFIPVLVTYFQFTESDKIPWPFYFVILIFCLFPAIGIIINLVKRIDEIKGGEEDEASKY